MRKRRYCKNRTCASATLNQTCEHCGSDTFKKEARHYFDGWGKEPIPAAYSGEDQYTPAQTFTFLLGAFRYVDKTESGYKTLTAHTALSLHELLRIAETDRDALLEILSAMCDGWNDGVNLGFKKRYPKKR